MASECNERRRQPNDVLVGATGGAAVCLGHTGALSNIRSSPSSSSSAVCLGHTGHQPQDHHHRPPLHHLYHHYMDRRDGTVLTGKLQVINHKIIIIVLITIITIVILIIISSMSRH